MALPHAATKSAASSCLPPQIAAIVACKRIPASQRASLPLLQTLCDLPANVLEHICGGSPVYEHAANACLARLAWPLQAAPVRGLAIRFATVPFAGFEECVTRSEGFDGTKLSYEMLSLLARLACNAMARQIPDRVVLATAGTSVVAPWLVIDASEWQGQHRDVAERHTCLTAALSTQIGLYWPRDLDISSTRDLSRGELPMHAGRSLDDIVRSHSSAFR